MEEDLLSARPATPSLVASGLEYQIAHVSRSLQRLVERDLVELVVPESR
jgi:predicted transcriptional regulator